jgi:hypothetical protein
MGVADLRLRPPPRGGETARGRKVGRGGPDERINVVKNGQTVDPRLLPTDYGDVN